MTRRASFITFDEDRLQIRNVHESEYLIPYALHRDAGKSCLGIENQIRKWHEAEDEEAWRAIQIRESLMRAPIGKTRMATDAAIEMIWGCTGQTGWAPRDVPFVVIDECEKLAKASLHQLVDEATLSVRYGIERQPTLRR